MKNTNNNFAMGNHPEDLDRAMVRIPGGKTTVGLTLSQKMELARQDGVHLDMLRHCSPRQETEIKEFWMDRFPVTRGQFRRFVEATGYRIVEDGWQAGWTKLTQWHDFSSGGDALPMVGVNAADAAAYAAWRGKRLPTHIEWERAWRGDDGRLFPWGDQWEEQAVFRSDGNRGLHAMLPVGSCGETGPFGLAGYGLVLEWVRATGATECALVGGSFLHTRRHSFLVSHRSRWHDSMRMYNTGFRCVADRPPRDVVTPSGCQSNYITRPEPVAMRKEAYLQEPIRLLPQEWATILIEVPWFPESIWVLDCPEATWGGFGGANEWPGRPREEWLIPWKVHAEKNGVVYLRERGRKFQAVEVWVEGAAVHYHYQTRNIEAVPSSFCFKSFSPFFTSQERRTQCVLNGKRVVRCDMLPLETEGADFLRWSVGEVKPPARFALVSFDGKGRINLPERPCRVSGNGFYPCIHVQAANDTAREGKGGFEFHLER